MKKRFITFSSLILVCALSAQTIAVGDNPVNGTVGGSLAPADQAKLDNLTVTSPIDLDALVTDFVQNGTNGTTFFEIGTHATNNIEIGASGSLGGTPYVRIQGGGTATQNPLLYFTDNHASLTNYTAADALAVGATSLITRGIMTDYVDGAVGGGGGITWATPVNNNIVASIGTGSSYQIGIVQEPFWMGHFKYVIAQGEGQGGNFQVFDALSDKSWQFGNTQNLFNAGVATNPLDFKFVFENNQVDASQYTLNHTGSAVNPNDLVPLKDFDLNAPPVDEYVSVTNIPLEWHSFGDLANPSSATVFTTDTSKRLRGGSAKYLINTASKPTVDGSNVNDNGASWEANTDKYLVIWFDGVNVHHFYLD
ncbi:hypothetical protein [Flagellimonas sp. CMM7]|uniref:hypothetical protein n=1 Tax=Flagellimonas sp. CMM7 TaxID=2654676 RepID=UPI0013D5932D|nr:hypothetical protein [Flagellimonas sp. CMM7]UII79573.1 hypothetical protein LV704_18170 [Flagellimonas sp. CMM7]